MPNGRSVIHRMPFQKTIVYVTCRHCRGLICRVSRKRIRPQGGRKRNKGLPERSLTSLQIISTIEFLVYIKHGISKLDFIAQMLPHVVSCCLLLPRACVYHHLPSQGLYEKR